MISEVNGGYASGTTYVPEEALCLRMIINYMDNLIIHFTRRNPYIYVTSANSLAKIIDHYSNSSIQSLKFWGEVVSQKKFSSKVRLTQLNESYLLSLMGNSSSERRAYKVLDRKLPFYISPLSEYGAFKAMSYFANQTGGEYFTYFLTETANFGMLGGVTYEGACDLIMGTQVKTVIMIMIYNLLIRADYFNRRDN